MQQFFASFSASFLLALVIWPFLAIVITLPILVWQYRRYNTLVFRRVVETYLFVLYGLALVSFTLYPMPDDPARFCLDYALSPQLVPLTFFSDIANEGLRAILQVVMNIVFFLPFGVFARLLLGWKIARTILVGCILSLCIETAQLTGAFWIYPCSYRLFDVDDILLNTLGAVIGYVVALVVPRKELVLAEKNDVVRRGGLLRYCVAFILDQCIVMIMTIFLLLILYIVAGNDIAVELREWVALVLLIVVHMILPLIARGWSIGSKMVRLNHDDRPRGTWHRLVFYSVRMIIIWLLVGSHGGWITSLLLIVIVVCWYRWKKLPYQFI